MSKPIELDKTQAQAGDLGKGTTDHVHTSDSVERNNTTVPRQNGKIAVQKKNGDRNHIVDSQIGLNQVNGQHLSRKRRGNRPKNVEGLQTSPNPRPKMDRLIQDTTVSPRTTQNIGHRSINSRPIDTCMSTTQNAHSMPDSNNRPNDTIDRLESDSPKSTKNNSGSTTMEEGETELQRKYAAARALSEMATGLFISTTSEIHTSTQSTAPPPPPHPPTPPHTTSPTTTTTPPTERGFPGHSPPPPGVRQVVVGSGARSGMNVAAGREEDIGFGGITDQGVIVIAPIAPTASEANTSVALPLRLGSSRGEEGVERGGVEFRVGEGPPLPQAPVSTDMESKAPLTYQFYQGSTATTRPPPPHISPHHHQHHHHHSYPPHHPAVAHTGKSPSLGQHTHSLSSTTDLASARRVTEGAPLPATAAWEAQFGSAHRGLGVIGPTGGGEAATTPEMHHLEMSLPGGIHMPTGGGVYRLHQMKIEPPDQHLRGGVHPTGASSFGRDLPEEAQNLCMRDMARPTTSTVTSNSENKDVPKSLPLKKRKYVSEEPGDVIESPTDVITLPRQRQQWGIPPVNHPQSKIILDDVEGPVGRSNGVPAPSMAGYPRYSWHQSPVNLSGMAPHYVTSSMTNGGMSLTSGHRIVSQTEYRQTNMPLDFSSGSNRTSQAASHSVSSLRATAPTTVIRTQEPVSSHNLNEMRKVSTFVNKLSAQHDRKYGSEEFGAQLRKMAAAAAAFASGGSSAGPAQQRLSLGSRPATKPPQTHSPITLPVTIPSFLPPSITTANITKDHNHHPHLKRKGSTRPHDKQKVFVGTERLHTETLSGRKAGRDGMWHPDGGGKVRLVMTNIDSSMKQPQTRLGGRAGSASWEQVEPVTKNRVGTAAGGGAGVEGETMLPSSTEAEAADHGAGAAEVKDEESSPLRINPQDSLRMLQECEVAVRPDEDGDLPLHVAVVQGNLKTIHKLIQLMARKLVTIDYCNLLRQTPLHLAVITKQPDIVQVLLGYGASANYTDRVGNTSVHLAVKHQTLPCLDTIIKHSQRKPNLNQKNFEGLAPLHVAVQIKDETLIEAELELKKIEIMKTLLVAGAETDITDGKSGRTPLHHAVETQQIKLVEMLLQHHSKVNVQSYAGNTALHTASERNYKSIMRLLMDNGADTTIKNANHETYNSVSKETKPPLTGREASFGQTSPSLRIPKVENVEEVNPPTTMKLGQKRGRILRLKSVDSRSASPTDMTVSSPRVLQQRKSPELLGAASVGRQPSEPINLRTKPCSPGINPIQGVKSEGQIDRGHGSKSEGHIMWAHGSHVDSAPAVRDQPRVKSEKPDTLTSTDSEHCVTQKSVVGPTPAIPCSVMSCDNIGTPHSSPTNSQQGFPQLPTPRVGQTLEGPGVIRHYAAPAPISSLTSMVNHLQRTDEPIKALRIQHSLSHTSLDPQPRKVKVSRTVYPKKEAPALSSDYESIMYRRKVEDMVRHHSGLSLQNLPGGKHKETGINDGKAMPSDTEASQDVPGLQHKTLTNDCPEPMQTERPEKPQIVVSPPQIVVSPPPIVVSPPPIVVSPKENNEVEQSQIITANITEAEEESTKETGTPCPGSVLVPADDSERKSNITSKPQSVDEVMTAVITEADLTELTGTQKDEGSKENANGSRPDERCKAVDEVQKELSVPKPLVEIKVPGSDSSTLPCHEDQSSTATSLEKPQSPGIDKKSNTSLLANVPESPDILPRLVICETEEASAAPGKKRRNIDEIGMMLASSSQKKISSSSHSAETDEETDKPNTISESKDMKQLETDESIVPLPPCPNDKDIESNQTDSNETVLNEFTGQLLVRGKPEGTGGTAEQDELADSPASPASSPSKS